MGYFAEKYLSDILYTTHNFTIHSNTMMGYNYMMGGAGGGMMFFAWLTYILVISLLILGILALWKYISKK